MPSAMKNISVPTSPSFTMISFGLNENRVRHWIKLLTAGRERFVKKTFLLIMLSWSACKTSVCRSRLRSEMISHSFPQYLWR